MTNPVSCVKGRHQFDWQNWSSITSRGHFSGWVNTSRNLDMDFPGGMGVCGGGGNPPTKQEIPVWSLEKEMTTHSSILPMNRGAWQTTVTSLFWNSRLDRINHYAGKGIARSCRKVVRNLEQKANWDILGQRDKRSVAKKLTWMLKDSENINHIWKCVWVHQFTHLSTQVAPNLVIEKKEDKEKEFKPLGKGEN